MKKIKLLENAQTIESYKFYDALKEADISSTKILKIRNLVEPNTKLTKSDIEFILEKFGADRNFIDTIVDKLSLN